MEDKTLEFLNVGKAVNVPSMGELTFKTLCVEDLQLLATDLINFIILIQKDLTENSTSMDMIKLILINPESLNSLKKIIATSCNKKVEDFNRRLPKDYLVCVNTFLEVNDIKELKSLFLEILRSLGMLQEPEPNADSK